MATSNKKAPVRKSNTRYASSSKVTKSRPKSRTGSSSLARSSKSTLFTKRNGLIAAGMAAIAGLAFVALSFASGAPKYQYSFSTACIPKGGTTTTPAPTDAEQLKAQQACYDDSAEGLTYRIYKGVFNREPNAGEYAYWVQQLAGDRTPGTTFVSKMVASNGAAVPKTSTDAQFITGLYKNMLLRTDDKIAADKRGTGYWTKKLQGTKKWSRAKVAYHFATTSEAKRANATTFVAYISVATPVAIKENAKEAQAKRLVEMKKYATTAGKNATAAKKAENAAKSALGTAKASSSLEAIAANKATAAAEAAKARTAMRAAKTAAGKADRLKKRARALAVYAKDIGADPVYGMAKINDVHKLTKAYSTNASKSASTAGKTLAQIDAAYAARQAKIAEEAAAAEAAAQAAANANSSSSSSSGDTTLPDCKVPINKVREGASAKCIKRVQEWAGLEPTGNWSTSVAAAVMRRQQDIDRLTLNCNEPSEVKRGNSCVSGQVYARSFSCPDKYHKEIEPWRNRSKYFCYANDTDVTTPLRKAPQNFICYAGDKYRTAYLSDTYRACVRRDGI